MSGPRGEVQVAGMGVLAVVAVGTRRRPRTGWARGTGTGEPFDEAADGGVAQQPDDPRDSLVAPGEPLPLPERGEVVPVWLAVPDDLPVPVFVVRDPQGATHAVAGTTPNLEGVAAAVGWCEEGAVLVSWRRGVVFAPDGSYEGGPPPRGLDIFQVEVTDESVRIGDRRLGVSRGASRERVEAQERAWGRQDGAACLLDGPSPEATLRLHGLPGVPFEQAAASALPAGEVAMDGPERPDGMVLVNGTFVYRGGQPSMLCTELDTEDPPACPPNAPRVRMAQLADNVDTWAETGLFRAVVVGSQFDRLTLVTADLSHVGSAPPEPLPDPPLQPGPDVIVQDDVVIVPAHDLSYGRPPEPIPTGTYDLRLDNNGHLPHTLVNNELGVKLVPSPARMAPAGCGSSQQANMSVARTKLAVTRRFMHGD